MGPIHLAYKAITVFGVTMTQPLSNPTMATLLAAGLIFLLALVLGISGLTRKAAVCICFTNSIARWMCWLGMRIGPA